MNNEDFVSYETAQALKKAGFDWPCDAYYTKEEAPNGEVCFVSCCNQSRHQGWPLRFLAPTMAKVQKWLIAKGIFVEVSCFGRRKLNPDRISCSDIWAFELVNTTNGDYLGEYHDVYEDYNSCLSAGIEAALKLIEGGEDSSYASRKD